MPDSPSSPKIRARFAALALATTLLTYALIVFGGVVRITGSGMGCGDDWPTCNGRLIPAFDDLTVVIEWGHRMAAALIGFVILGLGIYAWKHRRTPGFRERAIFKLSMVAVGLLLVVVLFGRATVQLELPPATVVVHLALASVLLATLLVTAIRAVSDVPAAGVRPQSRSHTRWAWLTAGLGYVVLLLGGLVATTGAAPLCGGFPLCNGEIVPEGGALVHLHWTHRLLAYGLVTLAGYSLVKTLKAGASRSVRAAAWTAVALLVAQIVVAAAMVLGGLPLWLRAAHLAVGVAAWSGLVLWGYLAATKSDHAGIRRDAASETVAAAPSA